jgi:GNAT superfamily N-acetyltransferase
VTAVHTIEQLKQINDAENAVVAFDNDKIVAYAIAMRIEACPLELAVYKDLFDTLDGLSYKNKKLSEYKMILVGQLCVDKAYRGQGLVPNLYKTYKEILSKNYEIAVTDINEKNPRSLKAHQNSGFEVIHTFNEKSSSNNWHIVLMDLTK